MASQPVFADTEFDAVRDKLLAASVRFVRFYFATPSYPFDVLQEAVLALAADHGLNVRDSSAPTGHLHILGGSSAVHDRTSGAHAALKQLVTLTQDPSVSRSVAARGVVWWPALGCVL